MSIERVREVFTAFGIANRIQEFDVSSATVELAAAALGCESKRIAKTIGLYKDEGAILIVAAGDAKIDNHKFKETFGIKPKMLHFEDVEQLTGHGVGGVCPFAVNTGAEVYLDTSLRRFDTVFPACGSANSAIELTLPELEAYSDYQGWVDVCRLSLV